MPEQDRTGRFSDTERGSSLLGGRGRGGLIGSTDLPDTFTRKDVKRNLKPFKKFGLPQKLGKFRGKTDTQLENLAAQTIVRQGLKRGSLTRKKLRTSVNRKKFSPHQLKRARRVMQNDSPGQQAKKNTRAARKHIRRIRRNREIMKKPLFRFDTGLGNNKRA